MASAIFSKLSSGTPEMAQVETPTSANPVSNLINQILGSANPQQMFNQMLSTNKDAQNAMNLINQYGNGDPKAAFMNYMNSQGKQAVGQQIMQKLGLS